MACCSGQACLWTAILYSALHRDAPRLGRVH